MDSARRAIARRRLFKQGDGVVIALSGGADSVALLRLLLALRAELGLRLAACHVDHQLRGAESDADAAFCRALCARLGVELTVCRVDVKSLCRREGLSVEEGARRLRYQALAEVAKGRLIATAHTRNDSVETVLLNLTRGTGLDGLCGIPPRRGTIVRPLLDTTRAEVEDYLNGLGQDYVTDASNAALCHSRNRLRKTVLPELLALNPALLETVGRMTALLRLDADCLEGQAAAALETAVLPDGGWRPEALAELHPAVRLRALRALLRRAGLPYDARRLRLCDGLLASDGAVELTSGRRLCRRGERLWLAAPPGEALPPAPVEFSVETPPAVLEWGGKRLEFSLLSGPEIKFFVNNHPIQFKNAMDCAKIDKILKLRARLPGDRLALPGRRTRPLKKLLNEQRLSPERRDRLALLESGEQLVWAQGFGAGRDSAATADSKQALLVQVMADDGLLEEDKNGQHDSKGSDYRAGD